MIENVSDEELELFNIITDLHSKFEPHEGQVPIGRAILYEGAKKVFANCGRSFGKSKLNSYLHVRIAKQNPGCTNYIFLPYITQGREVYWTPKLIQQLLNDEDVESINNTEMRIVLKNKSQIKICGADNVDSYRGVKPNPGSIITFEECKDLKEEFISAFLPNLSVNDPILFMVGTPAEFDGVFSSFMELAKTNPTWRYFHSPTETNPYVSKEWIEEEKQRLISMGEYETFLREYMGIYVKGGKRSIYPWILTAKKHKLNELLPKDLNKWRIIVALDPAATSTFGVLFAFWNEYTKKLIVFDEIYQQDPLLMTAKEILRQIKEITNPWKDKVRSIDYVYDEAAAYIVAEFGELDKNIWLEPSRKSQFGVDGYINLVRNIMNHGIIEVTENCEKFWWEHENYMKDDNNRIPKKNDHLVNCLHYLSASLGLDFTSIDEPKDPHKSDMVRAYNIEDDMPDGFNYEEID